MKWLLPQWTQNLLMSLIRDFWEHFPQSSDLAVIFCSTISESTNVSVYCEHVQENKAVPGMSLYLIFFILISTDRIQ